MPDNVTAISGLGTDSDGKDPNLIKAMHKSNIITSKVFCFYLTETIGVANSYLDIGYEDKTVM